MGTKLSTRPEMQSTPIVNVKAQKGQTFIGTLVGKRTLDLDFGPKTVYEFTVTDGDMPTLLKVNGEYVDCEVKVGAKVSVFAPSRLAYALDQVEVGQEVRITYLGLGQRPAKGGNKPHEYEVEVL